MKLTDAEWHLMNALWSAAPATAREVSERLPAETDWAYTTIKTMLDRLVAKGALSETKRGNASVYQPLVSREQARRSAVRSLAERAFDGALGPLMHFLVEDRTLTRRERAELRRLLDADDRTPEADHD